ncbi:hypothetical protein GCM10023184_02110 [Flaviaesturariibacter amylovorans]|uniref:Uncharacterized protein n=1 Tax=Flaviaesturariibacter amylovorans TaxID=1084520 RepID=A0ABP8G6N7_9BACT
MTVEMHDEAPRKADHSTGPKKQRPVEIRKPTFKKRTDGCALLNVDFLVMT